MPLISDKENVLFPLKIANTTKIPVDKKNQTRNLFPRDSHLTAPWGERGEILAHAGHVSPGIWEMTINLLKGRVVK